MSKGLKAVIIASVLVLFISTTAYAASSTFLPRAQQLYDQMCTRGRASGSAAMLCYLFDKTSELQTSVNNLGNKVQNVEEKTDSNTDEIDELKDLVNSQSARIQALESLLITPVPETKSGTFTPNVPVDVSGYSRITVQITGSDQDGTAIFYSDDQSDWILQSKFGEDFGSKSFYVFPVKGKYYKVTVWGSAKTHNYVLDKQIVSAPTADFTYTPQDPQVNQPMTFTNASTGETQFKWEFGTPYTFYNTNQSVNLTPTSTGSFTVHLYVQNAQGVIDTVTKTITVTN